jgi:hypothetical protein
LLFSSMLSGDIPKKTRILGMSRVYANRCFPS